MFLTHSCSVCLFRISIRLGIAAALMIAAVPSQLVAQQTASSPVQASGPRETLERIVALVNAGQAEEAAGLMTEPAIDSFFGEPLFQACMLSSGRIMIPGQTPEYDDALRKFLVAYGLTDYKLPQWFFEGGLAELSNPNSPKIKEIYREIYAAIEAAGKSRWEAFQEVRKVHAIGMPSIPNPIFAKYQSEQIDGDEALVAVEVELPEMAGQRLKANNYLNFVKRDGQWRFAGLNREETENAVREVLATLEEFQIGTLEDPQFAGVTLDGSRIDLADLKGKVVRIDFWGTWCGPCVAEFPALRLIYDAFHPHGLEVIGIAVDEPETLRDFFTKVDPLPWGNIADKDGTFAEKYGIKSFPTLLIIDQEGKHVASNLHGRKLVDELVTRLKLDPAKFADLKAELKKLNNPSAAEGGGKSVVEPKSGLGGDNRGTGG